MLLAFPWMSDAELLEALWALAQLPILRAGLNRPTLND